MAFALSKDCKWVFNTACAHGKHVSPSTFFPPFQLSMCPNHNLTPLALQMLLHGWHDRPKKMGSKKAHFQLKMDHGW